MKQIWTWIIVGVGVFLVGGALLVSTIVQAGAMTMDQPDGCSTPASVASSPNPAGEGICYPASQYGSAVVAWARKMADALYVNPSCGGKRGAPDCNDTWYTSAFPQPVIAYGQAWCHSHHDCEDWANGSYQCVSFVRGAYSQVYPMKYSNNAFGLWATYQHVPGWQEIPAAATADPAQRFLPEPGDVMVFKDLGIGHVAIVIAVQAPKNGKNGWVEFANANSSSAYDRMPLMPSLLVDTSEWASSGAGYVVWGYIRPKPAAAQRVVRINQLDSAQYVSNAEWNTWAYSACSAASMTEVLNAYGRHLRIHDVLVVEAGLGEITPADGLTEDIGIANTMRQFGMKTTWGEHWQLPQVVGIANGGNPVIVGWPPSRYAGGHIVVVTGGDLAANVIEIADSSAWNRRVLSVEQFMQWWAGFAAVATPA